MIMPVLPFWLETCEWDIDDDTNIVFTPHCPQAPGVLHNDDDWWIMMTVLIVLATFVNNDNDEN